MIILHFFTASKAVDASDVVILHDDLTLIDWLIGKSHKAMRIVRENLALALAVICLATTPALFGFIPLEGVYKLLPRQKPRFFPLGSLWSAEQTQVEFVEREELLIGKTMAFTGGGMNL